jgi:Ca2+-binding RTX toxin-like protein
MSITGVLKAGGLIVRQSAGSDGWSSGASGFTTVSLASTQLKFSSDMAGLVSLGNGVDRVVGTRASERIDLGAGDDYGAGGGGDDWIYGRRGEDRIEGWNGNDRVHGGRGDDALFGNQGNDVLRGGRGDDYLCAGQGEDFLYGGRGSDTFVFRPPEGDSRSTYMDFNPEEDTLRIVQRLVEDEITSSSFRMTDEGLRLDVAEGNELLFPKLNKQDVAALLDAMEVIF